MKKRKLPLIPLLGIGLVVIGCAVMAIFQLRLHLGAAESRKILDKLYEILPERTQGELGIYPSSGMPVLEIEGGDFVAILEIPDFGVKLPVANRWDANGLTRCPARFLGSAYDRTLVIGGADDPRQFGFCDKIGHGTEVIITDMTGAAFSYTVTEINRASHAENQWLMDEKYDLTLFCHDIYSMEYIAVRCVLTYRNENPA